MIWKKYALLAFLTFSLTHIGRSSGGVVTGSVSNQENTEEVAIPLTDAELTVNSLLTRYFNHRHTAEKFNGVVLVAHNGRPIYEESFGYSDIAAHKPLDPNTPFELASVSKTFTATAVLKLAEAGKLSLDDSISQFFPAFPYGITVRMLLDHRSGLPDYVYMDNRYITDRQHYMSNLDVVDIFCQKKPRLLFKPDTRFEYSNSNYALLAAIVQQATGMKFQKFVQDSIFAPLGMTHSYVFDFEDSTVQHDYARTHDAYGRKLSDVCFDGAVGDKGIFSTVEDMLKWDNALRTGKVLSDETLAEAYKPRSFERVSFPDCNARNYGYGWRMARQADGNNIIYHNGWWHGNNNVFARNLRDNTTIIILSNRLNQANYWTDPIWNMLKAVKEETIDEVAAQ